MAGYDPQKSGKPAIKTILQNEQKIHLYEDDPRNNEKFRKAHPNVVFEGIAPVPFNLPENVNSIKRHRNETDTKNFVSINGQENPKSGFEFISALEKSLRRKKNFDKDPARHNLIKRLEDENQFLFHEMLHEMYDLERDDDHESGADHLPTQKIEGADQSHDNLSLLPPVNLVAAVQQPDLSTSPQGGQPTWEVTLNFDVDGLTDDYEIRVIKIS